MTLQGLEEGRWERVLWGQCFLGPASHGRHFLRGRRQQRGVGKAHEPAGPVPASPAPPKGMGQGRPQDKVPKAQMLQRHSPWGRNGAGSQAGSQPTTPQIKPTSQVLGATSALSAKGLWATSLLICPPGW